MLEVGAVLLLLVVPYIAVSAITVVTGGRSASSWGAAGYEQAILHVGQIAALALIMWQSGDPFRHFGIVKDKPLRVAGIALVLLAMAAAIAWVLHPRMPLRGGVLSYNLFHAGGVALLGLFLYTVTSCTLQEMVYRCYLITRLQELLKSDHWAILVSFLLFGLIHTYQGLHGYVGASVFGLAFSIVFVRTRTLIPLAIAHFLYNLSVYLLYTAVF